MESKQRESELIRVFMVSFVMIILILSVSECQAQDSTSYRLQILEIELKEVNWKIEDFQQQRQTAKYVQAIGIAAGLLSFAIKEEERNTFLIGAGLVWTTGFVLDIGAGKKLGR